MKKIWFLSVIILISSPFIILANSEDDFFNIRSSSPSNKEVIEPDAQDNNASLSEEETTIDPNTKINVENFTTLNEIAVKVNNEILSSRDVKVFFALKQLSPFLIKASNVQEIKEIMAQILGLESYIKINNLSQVIPTRTDINRKIEFLNTNVGTKTLKETIEKIDSSKTLLESDIKRFFHYQSLYEKSFIYFLQQEFIGKILSPREDELRLLYTQLSKTSPDLFSSPAKVSLFAILIAAPNKEEEREKIIDQLMALKSSILKTEEFKSKKNLFLQALHEHSSYNLKTTKVIGPLDEALITQDFPEYKDLFLLEKGSMSNVIETNGIMRAVFIVEKENRQLKDIDDPQVKGRLSNMIYERKAKMLFQNLLDRNLEKMKVEYF